jgi:lipoprotein-anchoring transpeptidase ErfK/SrfK
LPLYSPLRSDRPIAEKRLRPDLRNEYGHAAHRHRSNHRSSHCSNLGGHSFGLGAGGIASAGLCAGRREPIRSERADKARRHVQKVTSALAPKTAPSRAATVPQTDSTVTAPTYATPAPSPSNRGLNEFFATIFAGPIMLSRAFRANESTYYAAPPGSASPAYAPQAYAAPNQPDPRDGPIDPKFLRQEVAYPGREAPGTIIVDTGNKFLYLIEGGGRALRYGIGVGRPGFLWAGVKTVTAKREWPDWRPPVEMLARRPDLPRFMPGGIDNPLGARALYLGSSLYRIHGSNEPWTIGTDVSSGCIRTRNEDVTDLYQRVKVGTKVVVI